MSTTSPTREIDCRTTVARLWDSLDDELDAQRAAEVDAHVRTCTECAEHYAFARTFLQLVASSWPTADESSQLHRHVVARLEVEGFRGT